MYSRGRAGVLSSCGQGFVINMYIGTVGSPSFFLRLITLLFVVYNTCTIISVHMYISIIHTPYIHIIIQSPDDRNRDV